MTSHQQKYDTLVARFNERIRNPDAYLDLADAPGTFSTLDFCYDIDDTAVRPSRIGHGIICFIEQSDQYIGVPFALSPDDAKKAADGRLSPGLHQKIAIEALDENPDFRDSVSLQLWHGAGAHVYANCAYRDLDKDEVRAVKLMSVATPAVTYLLRKHGERSNAKVTDGKLLSRAPSVRNPFAEE